MRADGSLAKGDRQRALLEAEGVPFRGDARRHGRGTIARRCGSRVTSRCEPRPRGFHLVTREVVGELPELGELRVGLLHVHIRHTSASLTLNENASPDVRRDFETWFNAAVPESFGGWTHTFEGADDMPAHIKASLLGPSLTAAGARRAASRSARGRGSTCASTATAAARAR